ncbi:30S ribosomal protein S6 [Haloferula rosea]|uniref:Small ribosomal subunit protein bS6 n=1 Tax=Haloferula rosea TaxID=490093 RepID=A0A934RBY5_9BACT|nr:30S ribosomal protein S6 [Haloferula rosea]MBK1827843.1 30S ribosomal protein S6 [Haloferula rosea]
MTRNYEGLIILNTKGIDGSIEDLISSVGKEIEAEGGKLDEVQQLGRRQFAYPAKHLDGGHYVNYLFEADSAAIEKIQSRLKLNDHVHLQHYQTR